jgi:Flp pilus assembly protein TadB
MNNPWIVVVIILAILLFICIIGLVISIFGWRKVYKSEKIRQERIIQEGTPVSAKVTRVVFQKEHRQYQVFASWQSRETGRVYYFQETYVCLMGVHRFRPKIRKGDLITVRIIFNQPTYYIVRNW